METWTRRNATGSLLPVLLIIILAGSVGAAIVYLRPGLPFLINPYPTNPFYDPSFGHTDWKFYMPAYSKSSPFISATTEIGQTQGFFLPQQDYNVNQGTLSVPVGMAADHYDFNGDCVIINLFCPRWTWTLTLGATDGCATNLSGCTFDNSYKLTGTIVGAQGGILLTSATPVGDPTCTNYAGGTPDKQTGSNCWAADYSIILQAQQTNPPCITGVTVCLKSKTAETLNAEQSASYLQSIGLNATQIAQILAQGLVSKTTSSAWYLYRMITSLQLQIVPPQARLNCVAKSNPCGAFQLVGDANGELKTWLGGLIDNGLNRVSLMTNTRIAFGVSVSGFAPQSSTDWFGIVGMWIGGQGMQTSGCSGSNTCNFVQGQHSQLALFQDAALTKSAVISSADTLTNLAQITNQTIQQVQKTNVYDQVFTYVDTQSLGAQYALSQACTQNTLGSCVITPTPIIVNVPLIYDIIGSYTTFFYQYPGIPPSGGSSSGTITGTVKDESNHPIAGACVGLAGQCSGFPGQKQTLTDADGKFTLSNIPAGTYDVYATKAGYTIGLVTSITVAVGSVSTLSFILSALVTAGTICIIPPIPSPVPYSPPLFGGLCFPVWLVVLGIGGVVVVAVLVFGGPGIAALGSSLALRGSRKR